MAEKTGVSGGATTVASSELAALARDPDTRVLLSPAGGLTLRTADGRTIDVPAADPLMAAFRDRPWTVVEHLEANRGDLESLVADAGSPLYAALLSRIAGDIRGDTMSTETAGPSDDPPSGPGPSSAAGEGGDVGDGRAVSGQFGVGFGSLSNLSGLSDQSVGSVAPLKRETSQFGRDDLKRGEVGAAGEELEVGTGQSLGHLTGLPDEEPGLRNGEKLTHSDNTRFTGFQTGVGTGIDHLWLLGDFEYYRAADDFRQVDEILQGRADGSPVYGPLLRQEFAFRTIEDQPFADTLFDPRAFATAFDLTWFMAPEMGTVEINPDGSFVYTPAPGFSGDAEFTFELTDPRTGEKIEETITIPVAAVVDPVDISGQATTPEDVRVSMPVSIRLGDPDGSETVEKVVVSGIPAGADFDWNATLGATVTALGNGSFVFTGPHEAILRTLETLTLLPPDDFSGRIVLGVDVTVAETNVPPGTEIITERTTIHHDYVVDVVAVADVPDVTGDIDEITPEDTRVLLDDLDGNLNDLDGSEVLRFTISGVDADAKLENAAGVEYSFTTAPDGKKLYEIPPAAINDVFFNPPPDAFGTFDGMTITAIATERSNGDTATATAPVRVVVTPVADPIEITSPNPQVDEDNAVNIGAGISISFGDPDGSEVLTDVTVTGFPQNAIVTFTDVGGVPRTVTVPADGHAISFNGGTEAQIRAALATLSVQPPPHSDVNIPLNIQATMIDGGVDVLQEDIDIIVRVFAVADTPTLTSPAHAGIEDQDINVPFQVGHPDVDGTEVVEQVVIRNVPAGFLLTATATPGATLTDNGGGTYTVTGTSDAAINQLLNTLVLDIQPGGARDDLDTNFSLAVEVTTIENSPTTSAVPGHADNPGGEVSQLRNTANFTLPVTVRPDVDLPTISGSTTANEDAIVNPANQAVTAPINFGNNITISQNDSDDGSEVISSIVLTGFPQGAVVTWTDPAGVPHNVTVPAGGLTVTLDSGTEGQIRTALQTVSIVPPLHDDADIDISVTVNKTDATGAEAEAADTGSITVTHTIIVNAVADGPSFGAAATGLEDTDIPFVVQDAGLTGGNPSLIDRDGSETYDFARFVVPNDATFGPTAGLPNGITFAMNVGPTTTEYIYRPGLKVGGGVTTTAEFEDFLRNGLTVRPPLDSDVNFDVDVVIGTIESNPTEAGGFSLERHSTSTTVTVDVTPAVDAWSVASTTTVNEDGIQNPADNPSEDQSGWTTAPFQFGADLVAGITKGETAAGDVSETISQVTITGFPDIADLNFIVNPGQWTIVTAPGQVTITSPLADPQAADTAIRAALLTLSLAPDADSDADIPLAIAITVTDTDPDNPADTTAQTFNGTHLIEVEAVADPPVINGSGTGIEDRTTSNLSISVTHQDNADGSERIRDVVIDQIPAGLLLGVDPTAVLALGATFTDNLDGTYTVTGPSDAAINEMLAELELRIDPGNTAREHLDTEYQIRVTATVEENNPTNDGHPGQPGSTKPDVARATTTLSKLIDVTITADADPINHSGQSVLVEDTARQIGHEIQYSLVDADGSEHITEVRVSGFPVGAIVNHSDVNGIPQPPLAIVTGTEVLVFSAPKGIAGETAIRTAVDTLSIQAPAQSDVNFDLDIEATTTDNDADTHTETWTHPVVVQAFADTPFVDAPDEISGTEDQLLTLAIDVAHSIDGTTDNSETLTVRITVPGDAHGVVGDIVATDTGAFTVATAGSVTTITGAPEGAVTITGQGGGVYLVEGPTGVSKSASADAIDAVLNAGVLKLDPRAQLAIGAAADVRITVESISTEAATAVGETDPADDDELAPNALDAGDNDTRVEIVTDTTRIVVNPILDNPQFNGGSSIVRENGGSTAVSDPNLHFNLGSDLGLAMVDRDGSQTLSLKLTGIPDTAVVDFGAGAISPAAGPQVIDGVTIDVNDVGGTLEILVDGTFDDNLPADVMDVLARLHLTLADDDDTDFTVGIEYASTEALTGATTGPLTDTHQVTVQAVADLPTISGSGQGPEDTFIAVPITVTLNDTDGQAQGDGSETLQSVRITGIPTETGGTGVASPTPQVQFRIDGVTYDWLSDTDIAVTIGAGSFTVDRSTDGTLLFTPATPGDPDDTRAIQAALLTLEIKRGDHVGNDYALSVRAISVESNPSEANNNGPGVNGDQIATATATRNATVNVDVIPVTDPVTITPPAVVTIDEDGVRDENGDGVAGVRLSNLVTAQITQHDADGSETLRYEITNLTGGTFSHGTFNGGTGTWSFTAAQYANAVWRPPLHGTGTFTGDITVFTQDQPNGGVPAAVVQSQTNFTINVTPDPDAPSVGGTATIIEDNGAQNFGQQITYSHPDSVDGSEEITTIVIDARQAIADGFAISFNGGLPANVSEPIPGVFHVTGARAAIDTAVDTFLITPPANSDANAFVDVFVQTTDATDTTFTDPGAFAGTGQDDTDGDGSNPALAAVGLTGGVDTATTQHRMNIFTLAVADAPDVTAGFIVEGDENDAFALVGPGLETIQVDRSADTDGVADNAGWGSERLHVEISGVPAGVTLSGAGVTSLGGGTFAVNAANEDQLNARLASIQVTPGNWSGDASLTITAITTEEGQPGDPAGASGQPGIEVRTATDIATIALRVHPEIDAPTITGNAVGTEDTLIKIPLRVDLTDRDGSEVVQFVEIRPTTIDPATGNIVDVSFADRNGIVYPPAAPGVWQFTPAQYADLYILPPLHWSSENTANGQGDIKLDAQAMVRDTNPDNPADFDEQLVPAVAFEINVEVREDADTPNAFPVTVSAVEDTSYRLGQAILAAAGAVDVATLTANTLVDTDGSERLSFVLSGVPHGVIPSSTTGTVTFIGNNQWSISADAIPNLVLPPDPNYSGTQPYSGAALSLRSVAQEIGGDQASSAVWTIGFEISPDISVDGSPTAVVDGLAGWTPGATITEAKDAGAAPAISLASIANSTYVDTDGSEAVLSFTLDFANVVGDAQILESVRALMGDPAASEAQAADWILQNRIGGDPANYRLNDSDGDLLFDELIVETDLDGNGEVIPAATAQVKIAGLSINGDILDDSDVNFVIPVGAEIRDRTFLPNPGTGILEPRDELATQTVDFSVNIEPNADTPTVSAANPDKNGDALDVDRWTFNDPIPLTLAGGTTDDDVALGRAQSERIYYVLRLDQSRDADTLGALAAPELVLIDAGGGIVGLDNGDGSWILSESELTAGVNLMALEFTGQPRLLDLTLTTVAEDGGTRATNSAGGQFQVIVEPVAGPGVGGVDPVPPAVDIAALLDQIEDTTGALANPANPVVSPGDGPDPDALPDPFRSISVMFEVPPGVTVTGATFNPTTGRWVASHTAFNSGSVRITPPNDSNAPIDIEVEAVAVGTNFLKASSGVFTHTLQVEAVADVPNIAANPDAGIEDQRVDLKLGVSLSDVDGSEVVGDFVYLRPNNAATIVDVGTGLEYPTSADTVDGVDLTGWYKVPAAELADIRLVGAEDWHGTVAVEIAAFSREASNNDIGLAQRTVNVTIAADADDPSIGVPGAPVVGTEDTVIDLTGLLSVISGDIVAANGAEVLSVKIENVPDGTLFSTGNNNGDGTWTIPLAALATLTMTPPTNFAGTMNLALTGIALELSNGDIATSSVPFSVEVAPVADTAELLPQNATVDATGRAALQLDVRMSDNRGALPGEQGPEEIRITFQNVPAGVALEARSGGSVTDNGGGEFVFQGTEDQSNDLAFAAGPAAVAATTTITIASAVTVDGASTLDLGFTDTFTLTVPAVQSGTDLVADTLNGTAATDLLFGAGSGDTLAGNGGADGLFGGAGADILTGGAGSDVFGWQLGDNDGSVDTITDFSAGDSLDVSDILVGFDADPTLANFVRFIEAAGDTTVQIDADGAVGGQNFQDLVVIDNVIGLDAAAMQANGNLIVS